MQRTDVLVIGGGIAGASAAYFLAAHRRVLLVERESGYGYHSTGRSAAEWTAVHFHGLMRAVVVFGRPFLDAPPPGFASVPLLRRRGNVMFAREGGEEVAEEFLRDAKPFNPDVEEISADRALEIVPFLRREIIARSFYDPENCEIDVDALHQGYLRGFRAAGGQTRSSVEFHGAEWSHGAWHARIGEETIEAGVIVNASGAWADVVASRCGVQPLGLEPRRRTAFTFDPGFDASRIPPVDDMSSGFYFKASGPVLMVSPGDQTPSAPCDAQPEELDVATAVDLFENVTTLEVRRLASRWAGLRTFVRDEQPVVGFAADAPGFFWLVGQGGGGIMSSPGMGELAATMIRGEELSERARALNLDVARLSPARLAGG
ncbi:MAG: FAD-binding oxidoreductase [Proteobacteria bacterium]|nr:FAD-binding oxidoreductase [Pseudomonadota bacterium]